MLQLRSEITKEVAKVDQKSESDSKYFVKLEELLGNVKELILKLDVSPSSSVSQETLSKMFSSLESNLKAELDPLLMLANLMPLDAPLIKTGVQGREKGGGSSVSKGVDTGSSKDHSQGKVVGKVMTTHIPTSLPTSMSNTSTTMISKPLTKCIVIGSSAVGSSSKPPPSKKKCKEKGRVSTLIQLKKRRILP